MPIPIIAAGIYAIGSIVGAKVKAGAAGKAADQQVASADKALGVVGQAYAPYQNVGSQAITTLGALSGLGPGPSGGGAPMSPGAPPSAVPSTGRVPSPQEAAWFSARSGPDGTMRTKEPNVPETKEQLMAAQAQTQSGYRGVQMRAPDGRTVQVPHDQVKEALARGGQVM